MAQFHVNQRVRYISGMLDTVPVGSEGRVEGVFDGGIYSCLFPGTAAHFNDVPGLARVYGTSIVPIVPPDEKADAFLARIKKLGSEPINEAPKVEVVK